MGNYRNSLPQLRCIWLSQGRSFRTSCPSPKARDDEEKQNLSAPINKVVINLALIDFLSHLHISLKSLMELSLFAKSVTPPLRAISQTGVTKFSLMPVTMIAWILFQTEISYINHDDEGSRHHGEKVTAFCAVVRSKVFS